MRVVRLTLEEMGCRDKPVIVIFNKMDRYEAVTFDAWLEPEVREQMQRELEERWQMETQGHCVFISATERRNLDGLRRTVLEKVRDLYRIRYPYKSDFYS
jgi:GTP-binding protein HflX